MTDFPHPASDFADERCMSAAFTVMVHDQIAGTPAAGLRMQVYWVEPSGDVLLKAASTNAHGTTAAAMIAGSKWSAGVYRLNLHLGDYLQQTHPTLPRHFDATPIVFVIDDASVGRQMKIELRADGYVVQSI